MTGDQKHTDHIATGQHLNRYTDQRYIFYFFTTVRKKLKFWRHTFDTFAFSANAKEPNFPAPKTNTEERILSLNPLN